MGWHGLEGDRRLGFRRLDDRSRFPWLSASERFVCCDRFPFQEDEWVGGVLSFGEEDDAPAVTVTMRDVRCSMVNFDLDSAHPAPGMLKAVVRAHQNTAGIYGAVTRTGRLAVGRTLFLHTAAETKCP